jgi:phospholipid/cholesterol/gamma-HCH transport system substrate-binding protein
MTTKPNYFKTGLFVILAVLLMLGAIIVFGAGLLNQRCAYFETYFDTSVHGLSVGSPVEARGVQIGQVKRIAFVRDEYDLPSDPETVSEYERYVMVVVSVHPDFVADLSLEGAEKKLELLVQDGLRIQLANEILTGIGYLQAEFLNTDVYTVLPIGWTPKRTYIPSAKSELSTLKDSVDKILSKLEKLDVQAIGQTVQTLLGSLNQAVADANIPDLSRDMKQVLVQAQAKLDGLDTQAITQETQQLLGTLNTMARDANVPDISRQAQTLLVEANRAVTNLNHLLAQTSTEQSLTNIPEVLTQLQTTLQRIDRFIAGQTPHLDETLRAFRQIAENLRELSAGLSRNPSEILFSKPPPKAEPLK